MTLDIDLRALAETQYSVLARHQARALGATGPALRHRLAGPDWDAATPRVLRLVGSPPSIRQRLMIAVLDAGPGAAVSHGSAAAMWRLPGFAFGGVEVSRHRDLGRLATGVATVHRPRLLPPTHLTLRHGIPVTSLARTILDVAADIHPGRLERLVDTVLAKSPSVLVALQLLLADCGAQGRRGAGAIREVLAARPGDYVPTASGLEARFARILAEAGQAPLVRQVDLGGHEWVGRVDFVDRDLRIVFEIDSDLHHTSPMDREHDRRRDEALVAAGWRRVVRVSEDEVWRRPDDALAKVRDTRLHVARLLVAGIDTGVSEVATTSLWAPVAG